MRYAKGEKGMLPREKISWQRMRRGVSPAMFSKPMDHGKKKIPSTVPIASLSASHSSMSCSQAASNRVKKIMHIARREGFLSISFASSSFMMG